MSPHKIIGSTVKWRPHKTKSRVVHTLILAGDRAWGSFGACGVRSRGGKVGSPEHDSTALEDEQSHKVKAPSSHGKGVVFLSSTYTTNYSDIRVPDIQRQSASLKLKNMTYKQNIIMVRLILT